MSYPATFEIATTDSLTGLLGPTYFRHLLREELLPQAREADEPLSLLHLDLDGFAESNARYGYPCGDQILGGVARLLQERLPATAVLSRYSGDEFAGALPATRLDDAFTLAEEVRRRIAAFRLPDYPDVALTCSIGLAALPGNGPTEVDLVRAADQALYQAKATGANKVALPLAESRMVTKTSHYTATQLERLAQLAKTLGRNEASLLREALDDVLKKYNDRLGAPQRGT